MSHSAIAPNAYPWIDASQLSPALEIPALWAHVISERTLGERYLQGRRLLKKIIKRNSSSLSVVAIENDASFGAGLASLMRTPRGRQAFFSHIQQETSVVSPRLFLAQKVFDYASKPFGQSRILAFCEQRSDELLYLSIELFSAWINNFPPEAQELETFSTIICSFAILQPEIRAELYSCAISAINELSAFLDPKPPVQRNVVRKTSEATITRKEVSPTLNLPFVSKSIDDFRSVLRSVVGMEFEASSLSVDDARFFAKGLADAHRKLCIEIDRYEAIRHSTLSNFNATLTDFNIRTSIQGDVLIPVSPTNGSIDESCKVIAALEASIQGLRKSASTIKEMCSRLEIDCNLEALGSTDISGYTHSLEARIVSLRTEIAVLARRDSEILTLLQVLTETPVFDQPSLLLSLVSDEIASLIDCTVGKKLSAISRNVKLDAIYGDYRLAGLLLGFLCQQDSFAGTKQVDYVLSLVCGDRLKQYDVLAFLDRHQLQQLMQAFPARKETIFEFVFATAVRKQNFEILLSLRPNLEYGSGTTHLSIGHEVISAVVQAMEDGAEAEILSATRLRPGSVRSSGIATRQLLDLIDQPAPAGGGLFHDLREAARAAFLLPLRSDLSRGLLGSAFTVWKSYGETSVMVETAIAMLPTRDQRHVENRHREKVASYLRTFERQLLLCTTESTNNGKVPLLSDKFRQLIDSNSLDPFSQRLREIITADLNDMGVQWPPADFAVRVNEGVVASEYFNCITPKLPNSWVAKCDGEVRLHHLLADELAAIAQESQLSSDIDIINLLCRYGKFKAAHIASQRAPELRDSFDCFVSQRISELPIAIVEEARELSGADEELQFLLQLHDNAIAEFDFVGAAEAIPEIDNRIQKLKLIRNPQHRGLVSFLEQLGTAIPSDASSLESMVEDEKARAKERRFHIEVLNAALGKIPASLRSMFEDLAIEIDQPNAWPASEDDSVKVADWIDYFADFILKKFQARRQKFANKLASWFVCVMKDGLRKPGTCDLQEFDRIRQGRERDFWEEDDILRRIQPVLDAIPVKSEPLPLSMHRADTDGESFIKKANDEGTRTDRTGLPTILEQFRNTVDELRRSQDAVGVLPSCTDNEIKHLCGNSKWSEVSRIVRQHHEFNDLPTAHLAETECLLIIAEASSRLSGNGCTAQLLAQACIATCSLFTRQQDYYLTDQALQERAIEFLISLCPWASTSQIQRRERAVLLVEHLCNCPKGDKTSREIIELLRRARFLSGSENPQLRGDLFLATCIWEEFRGVSKPASHRADLLSFLYANDQFDLLRGLAKKYAPGLSEPVMQCLEAFNQGASNPDALDEAVQLAAIVHERSSKEKIAPWTKLISSLNSRRKEGSDNEPLKLIEESVVATEYFVVVNASIIPSRNDWPLSLTIRVFDDSEHEVYSQDLLEGKALVRPRPVCIRVPIAGDQSKRSVNRLLYEVSGNSSQVDSILVRGSWTWKEDKPVEQFTPSELRRYWPCADGKDVKTREQHHGRFDVLEKTDSALAGDDGYQRSLLIVGQRRIGKTSLLNQVMNSHPPRKGACCTIFANVSGLDPSRQSLRHALYDKIVEQLQNAPGAKNEKILAVFMREGKDLRRVLRDIDPSQSIAGALEGMAKVLSRVSDGENDRIAFCLDEFQSVFAWKNTDEIKSLMWDLRQVVQSSKSVSLLMAGSGLTRRLTDSYDEALFGSIDTIDLHPFSIDREFEAVRDTFLPTPIRSVFQQDSEHSQLARAAHELTGGHPWYLAILGSSMAAIFGKTNVTPAMLSIVVEQLVNGSVNACGIQFRASNFYGHLFESLNVLGNRQTAIAQLVLLTIARNTTTDWRDCSESRIKQNELLSSHAENVEILDALKALEREQVIEKDRKNANRVYRIRVPMVAEALRHDANEIEDDALNMLKN